MSEMSQAERTELETTMSAALGALGFTMGTEPESYPFRSGFERGWLAGRDFGRERERDLLKYLQDTQVRATEARQDHLDAEKRERALEAALDFLADAERLDISQATVARFAHAILASPGEPEGDTTAEALNRRYAQPDHGPGEPASIVLTEGDLVDLRNGGCVVRNGVSITYD